MNPYIVAQIVNMKSAVENCRASCHWAAKEDDGKVEADEAAVLRRVDLAVDKFLKELKRIHKDLGPPCK